MIVSLGTPPSEDWDPLEDLVELWGGTLENSPEGRLLTLPIQHGLRRGFIRATLQSLPHQQLQIEVLEEYLEIHRGAVVLLLLSLAGALGLVAWPFFPALSPLMPMGLILAVAGWLLGVTRLQNRGLEEFVDMLSKKPNSE